MSPSQEKARMPGLSQKSVIEEAFSRKCPPSSMSGRTDRRLVGLTLLLASAFFCLDISLPLGVAGGVPYVAVVLLSLWSKRRGFTWYVAVGVSLLTVLGFLLSQPGGPGWMVLVNRFLALFAIWVAAVFSLRSQRARSAQLESETRLKESQADLTALVENTQDLMWSIDWARCLLTYNTAFASAVKQALGVDVSAGMSLDVSDSPERREWWDSRYGRALQGERFVEDYPDDLALPDRSFEVSFNPMSVAGQVIGASCFMRDISERKRAEEERERLIAALESQNAELERFTYTVSHDLKSPLITLKGFMGLLEQDIEDGDADAIGKDLQQMAGAADRMARLLSELLELSRVGRLVNPPEEVALGQLVDEAMALVAGQIIQRQVEVEVRSNLPTVFGDRPRLIELLQNLIDNAVKYMGDQPRPHIVVGARIDGDETVCYVCDNGIGIDPQYREKIFGLFDQLDRTSEGSGVGLALVKRIVEVHGGRIWVESDGQGSGSTFCFSLPSQEKSAPRHVVGWV